MPIPTATAAGDGMGAAINAAKTKAATAVRIKCDFSIHALFDINRRKAGDESMQHSFGKNALRAYVLAFLPKEHRFTAVRPHR